MTARRDAALAGAVLVAAVVVLAAVGARLTPGWLALGALGTVGFELVASRDPEAVRRRWERPVVQAASVVLALSGVALGAVLAPSVVLPAVVGALAAYLLVLAGSAAVGRSGRR
ncbi:hypothetical protein [Saliphagus infecundisoli]|uniref:Phosphatidate cytidylyltransferase n=1 Tax=Saliphagus infecundisoli TaxID=1849069 RepID=A0ABD5QG08_9EURY|nr:hypothetical protein [Saliphagus infecundisoli]